MMLKERIHSLADGARARRGSDDCRHKAKTTLPNERSFTNGKIGPL
jgi:hypothetical protein